MNGLLADIWLPSKAEFGLFSPELALIATIVAVLVVPLVAGRGRRLTAGVALTGTLVTLVLTVWIAAPGVADAGRAGFAPPDDPPMLLADNFSVFFRLFLLLFLALVIGLWLIGLSAKAAKPEREQPVQPYAPEFFVLLLTSALGMALMVGTLHLLIIVIAIEMASLPSYAIVGSNKRSRIGAEASLKYVMFGAGTAAIMVYGVSLLYGSFGTLYVPDIASAMVEQGGAGGVLPWIGVFAVCVGIAFKISAVPFHFWCPDVFQGAPIEVTTWLSVASKAAGLGLLVRVVSAFSGAAGVGDPLIPFAWGIGIVAALTCTVGNLAALRQVSVVRLLAYSSIAHAGYMMMVGAIFVAPPDPAVGHIAFAALIAYLFIYLIMNLGAFAVTAMVIWQTGSDHLSSFTGLGRRAPWLAIPMTACLFSLVGLPPLGGFAAKWWLLVALGEAAMTGPEQAWLWMLVVVAVINTAISLYYYVMIVRQMFLAEDDTQPAFTPPLGGLVMVNACMVALLLFGTVLLHPLGQRSREFASNLFVPSEATSMIHQPAVSSDPEPGRASETRAVVTRSDIAP